jgi:hypothetical protein
MLAVYILIKSLLVIDNVFAGSIISGLQTRPPAIELQNIKGI